MTPCCRVCGTELVGELVSCERCQTPHHKDCWEYWGRCATYACTGLEPPETRPAHVDEPAVLEVRPGSGRARYLPRRPMVESHRALMYSAEGAHVRLGHGEVAMQLPPDLALELPASRFGRTPANAVSSLISTFWFACAAIGVVLLLDLFGATMVVASFPLILLGAIRARKRHHARRADLMWLVREDDGELSVEAHVRGALGFLDSVRVRFPLIVPGGLLLRVRGVSLRPAFGGGVERDVVKAYRLQLACELPDGGVELIAPVAVPGKGEPRHDFLKELNRVRALGQQIATHYRVKYLEAAN